MSSVITLLDFCCRTLYCRKIGIRLAHYELQ